MVEAIDWGEALAGVGTNWRPVENFKSRQILQRIAERSETLALSELDRLGVLSVLSSFGVHYLGNGELLPFQSSITDGLNDAKYTGGFKVESKFPWPVSGFCYKPDEATIAIAIEYRSRYTTCPASLNIYGLVDPAINRMLISESNGRNLLCGANISQEIKRGILKRSLALEDADSFQPIPNVGDELVTVLSQVAVQWREWGIVPKDLARLGSERVARFNSTPRWRRFLVGSDRILSGGRV